MIRLVDRQNLDNILEPQDPSIAFIEPGTAMLIAAGLNVGLPYLADTWTRNVSITPNSEVPELDMSAQLARDQGLRKQELEMFDKNIQRRKAAGGRVTAGALASGGTSGFIGLNPVLRGQARQGEIQAEEGVASEERAKLASIMDDDANRKSAIQTELDSAMQIPNLQQRKLRLRSLQNAHVTQNGKPIEPEYSAYRNAANSLA